MRRLLLALIVAATSCAQAYAADAPCGTPSLPKWCASITSGAVTVIARDERREYAAGGALLEGPLPFGFSAFGSADVFAVQDGAGTAVGSQRSFRVVKAEAGASRMAVGNLQVRAVAGATFSIEGEKGAPLDPRQFDALLDVRLLIEKGHIAVRGGHDGAVGGWALGLDVEIPVATGPAIVARYELPFLRSPGGTLPWVITGGARFRVASFRLGK